MSEVFALHNETTAPEPARPALAATRRSFGMIPNLERVMANAPALLTAYSSLWELFDTTSLSPVERQVVYQTANFENDCTYCVPWHSYLAKQAGMSVADSEALRAGRPLETPRLEALRSFARQLIHNRGKVSESDLEAFLDAGYSAEQALEVVLGLAIKVMSNYTNALAGTPLDAAVTEFAWRKPTIAMRSTATEPETDS